MLDEATTAFALRRLRNLSGMSERTAARALGTNKRMLRSWENQMSTPNADHLSLAVSLYAKDVRHMVDREPLVHPDCPGILQVGDEEIIVADHTDTAPDVHEGNRRLLKAYLAALARQRGNGPSDRVELRSADMAALAVELDMTDRHLGDLLTELFDLTPTGTQTAMRAMLAGALMAIVGTGMMGATWVTASAGNSAGHTEAAQVVAQTSNVFGDVTLAGAERSTSPMFSTSPGQESSDVTTGPGDISDDLGVPSGVQQDVFSVTPREIVQEQRFELKVESSSRLSALPAGSPKLPESI